MRNASVKEFEHQYYLDKRYQIKQKTRGNQAYEDAMADYPSKNMLQSSSQKSINPNNFKSLEVLQQYESQPLQLPSIQR